MLNVGEKIDDNHTYFKANGRPYLNPQEITQFLNAHGPVFWSWGAKNFTKISDSTMRFEVNGHLHKGFVYIYLNYMDAFDIYLSDLTGNIVKVFEDIYIDELVETIDTAVEKIDAYKK